MARSLRDYKAERQAALDKKAEMPDTLEEHYYLALESILRWSNRDGYPVNKIRAIRRVAAEALLRDDGTGWTPHYKTVVGEEIPDLRGAPFNR